ncbi:unnamed protein product, partial [Dicrocoelium dendriticum]
TTTERLKVGSSLSSTDMNKKCLNCGSCKKSRNKCLINALSNREYSDCRHAQSLLKTLRRTK